MHTKVQEGRSEKLEQLTRFPLLRRQKKAVIEGLVSHFDIDIV